VGTLRAAAVRAEDGVGPIERVMGSTASSATGGLSESGDGHRRCSWIEKIGESGRRPLDTGVP
jgi:hypothetical protein